MKKHNFTGILKEFIEKAENGLKEDIDFIMSHLHIESTLVMTRYVDYALSLVENEIGVRQLEHYLFNGSLIQRNYSSLFFNRRGDYDIVVRAYKEGKIDDIQAFAR
ncbi:MAG: hypothetical protein JXQ65_00255 [Candidatus Marinimicrobia bacterium]|nr:hypothetical protein [Candidatus Neomarinimicrobiota bacterium]